MKIAFLTAYNPRSRRPWSGTIYCMVQTLQKYCGEVSAIGPMYAVGPVLLGRIINLWTSLFFKKRYLYLYSIRVSKHFAKIAARHLARERFDVIVAPLGWLEIAFLQTSIPIVYVSDITFGLTFDYYFSHLSNASCREMDMLEKRVTEKASALVFSSSWAARSSLDDYHADPAKVYVAPMGANFDHLPTREVILQRRKSSTCKLLFVGRNWRRKGGEIAFETLLALEERGIKAELTICGCVPPKQFFHERMQVIPYLDKNDPQQYDRLARLYLEADFLLLPTRADCTPIVLSEASAYGLPAITTRTGGVPEVVRDGQRW